MDTKIGDPWYSGLSKEKALEAGYFDETKNFESTYYQNFDLPINRVVVQYSGAFFPLHNGHLSCMLLASAAIKTEPVFVIHVDHAEYRESKGDYDNQNFKDSFKILDGKVNYILVFEDEMPNGCSRNFTRLYSELSEKNGAVWFLSGGDRANYALSFKDKGNCIIAGRDQSENYKKYESIADGKRILFLPGNHPASSSAIRKSS